MITKKTYPATGIYTQRQAKAMHQLLTEIHDSLKDRNRNKKITQIPFIEFAWMTSIEKYIPKNQQVIRNNFKKFRNKFSNKIIP